MRRRLRHRHGLEPRRQIDRAIRGQRIHALDHGFMDERVFRNEPRLGVGDVEAEMRLSIRPFPVRRALRQELQQPPRAAQRGVEFAFHIGRDVVIRAVLSLYAPGELIDGAWIDLKATGHRLIDHPEQRIFRKSALGFGIAAADIGMDAGEPHLLDILRLGIAIVEAVMSEGLRRVPFFQPKHAAPLVDRNRLAENLHARILQGVGELFQARPVKPVRPRHDHARDRVPDADEMDGRPACRENSRELRRLVAFGCGEGTIGIAGVGQLGQVEAAATLAVGGKLLVGGEAASCEIGLLRRDQPDFVDQPRQHPHAVGAAGKAEQVDVVAFAVMVDQEQIGGEHLVIEAVAGGEPEDGAEILLQLLPRIRPRQRADARIVKHHLPRRGFVGLAQAAIELEHIGNVLGDLVAGAVAADDDVAHGEPQGVILPRRA